MTQTETNSGHHPKERALLCELLRQFYDLGWCTGTGGGLSLAVPGGFLMAPSGVAKERVTEADLFLLDEAFRVIAAPTKGELCLSECAPLFQAIFGLGEVGAVIHSHSIPLALATRAAGSEQTTLGWQRLEMLKGIRGVSYPERHFVPLIDNTPREAMLLSALQRALENLPPHAHAVFVRDHGAYIWGRDAMEAKRHAEVYDWLCEFDHRERLERNSGNAGAGEGS